MESPALAFILDSPAFASLEEAFARVDKLSYCDGTLKGVFDKDSSMTKLFYCVGDKSEFIDFGQSPTNEELEALTKACSPATFGHKDKDVLDESYRKAGKMEGLRNFAWVSRALAPITDG